jgi:hypothetical protein
LPSSSCVNRPTKASRPGLADGFFTKSRKIAKNGLKMVSEARMVAKSRKNRYKGPKLIKWMRALKSEFFISLGWAKLDRSGRPINTNTFFHLHNHYLKIINMIKWGYEVIKLLRV